MADARIPKTFDRRKWLPAEREDICTRYVGGEDAGSISRSYGVGYMKIWHLLKRSGIEVRSRAYAAKHKPRKRQDIIKSEVIDAYRWGYSILETAALFGCSSGLVQLILVRNKIPPRKMVEAVRYRLLNESAFSTITPSSAYWAGFLMADGNVFKNNVTIALAEKDLGHIKKFRDFVGSFHKIGRRENNNGGLGGGPSSYISVMSEQMVEDLAAFGVIPRKTFIAEARGGMELEARFWAGMVDGDGTVGWSVSPTKEGKRPLIMLCGASPPILDQYLSFIKSICPDFRGKVRRRKDKAVFHVYAYGRFAVAVIKKLYGEGGVSLDRKQVTANEIMEWYRTRKPPRIGRPPGSGRTISDRRQAELF